jgi:hypothetical protein
MRLKDAIPYLGNIKSRTLQRISTKAKDNQSQAMHNSVQASKHTVLKHAVKIRRYCYDTKKVTKV